MITFWTVILVVVLSLFIAGVTVLEGYYDFKAKSKVKVPMFWCSTCQTAFPEKHCLELFPGMHVENQQGGKVLACPMCYQQAVFNEPNARLK